MSFSTSITRRYHFESAHYLPKVHEGHKCRRMHGHNYEMEVTVAGPIKDDGFIIDFWDLDKLVQPIVNELDHRTLNDIPGLSNPTAENIAAWFLLRIRQEAPKDYTVGVRIYETKDCWAEVI